MLDQIIRDQNLHNLAISVEDVEDNGVEIPVLLFTPHMRNPDEHYHIELSYAQARKLRDFLNDYLKGSN